MMEDDFEPTIWYREVNSFKLKISLRQRVKNFFSRRRRKNSYFAKAYEQLANVDHSKLKIVKILENE